MSARKVRVEVDSDTMERLAFNSGAEIEFGPSSAHLVLGGTEFVAELAVSA